MLPLQLLADPARQAALSAMVLFGAVVVGYVFFTSLYPQAIEGCCFSASRPSASPRLPPGSLNGR